MEWAALGLLILLCLGYLSYALNEEHARIEMREQVRLTDQCNVVSMNLERQFNAINAALSGIVKEVPGWRRQPDGASRAEQHLRALNNAMPGVLTFLVIDSGGTVLASDKPELLGQNLAERDYFQSVLKNPSATTLYVRPPFVSKLGNFTMNLVRMVAKSNGEFDGLVIAALDSEEFKILLNSVLYRPDIRASLIHGDGVPFLMAPNKRNIAGLDLVMPGSFFSRHIESGRNTNVFEGAISTGDETRMIALQTVHPTALSMDKPMVIAVDRGLTSIYANWHRELAKSLGLFGLCTLLAAFALLMWQRRRRASALDRSVLELDRRHALEALQQSDERFRSLTELSSDWYWEQNEQFRFVPLVGQLNEKTRSANQAHVGKARWEMGAANLTEADWQAHRAMLLAHEEFHDFEMLRPDRSGVAHWLSISGRPIFDSAGNFRGYRGVARDITERKLAADALRAREERFQILFSRASEGIVIISPAGKLVAANESFARMHGYTVDEIQQLKLSDLNTPATFNQLPARIQRILAGERLTFEAESYHKDGHAFPLEVSSSMISIDGEPMIQSFVRDISDRKQGEKQLRLAASVFTHAREGIMITAANGAIIDVNEAFTRITRYRREEVIGLNPRVLRSGRQGPDFYVSMWRDLIDLGHWDGEVWNRRKDGEEYAEMLTISAVRDEQGITQQYVALFTDITPFKEHERHLELIAHHDVLTTLPNRVLLADRLHQSMTQAQRRQERIAVAYIDLDGFKAINDHHGHDAGDSLLVALAARMKQALREGDTLARIGGDEFVAVLLDIADARTCDSMLTRLLAAAAEPVQFASETLQVSASIGVSFFPQPVAISADQLLHQADQAMYQAKLSGKNRFCFADTV